ncbi:MAG TPA: dCTP deaminase, partial [Candidatus Melainabacteria bacterium]|nr:dCTP deaminase [Candidatus Melainabacteria bacterium]
LPDDIVGQLTGKSSLARLGVMVHVTAGFIDAGFSTPPAQITLEIYNVGNRPVRLHAGMAIGQMVFTRTTPCELPYNKKPSAKYNGQKAAAHSECYLNKVQAPSLNIIRNEDGPFPPEKGIVFASGLKKVRSFQI